ncbi:MAG TPA: hypothetical protein VGQ83_33470 [Polyangia bacterium]|jgi:hypothetical protein
MRSVWLTLLSLSFALPLGVLLRGPATAEPRPAPKELKAAAARAQAALLKRHGAAERPRVERGVAQVLALWLPADGDGAALEQFLTAQFAPQGPALDAVLQRFEESLEQVDGLFNEMTRELRRRSDLDLGPMTEVDKLTAGLDPGAHLGEDLFQSKLAFVALLNFPLTTLDERLARGPSWSRREWAEARLAQRFYRRVPGAVQQKLAEAGSRAELYIAEYNIYMHHVVDRFDVTPAARPFPRGLRLISHWNLRDELKSRYADREGLRRQRLILRVMERIVDQSIPRAVIDSPRVDWNPITNEVRPAPAATIEEAGARPAPAVDPAREPDTRYARLLDCYRAARLADPFSPSEPTLIARRFNVERELPEPRVEALLKDVLQSPLIPRLARLIQARLGRPLEPFDIWYSGLRAPSRYSEAELDAMVRKRYPSPAAFQKDLPRLLVKLGFTPARARYLAERIAVDPARGAGHAMGAYRRQDKPHLRTRILKDGMNYKGFNIAVHELGHNVEQVFSLYDVDRTLLMGVPNTGFTEALAFVFQARDLELLGLPGRDAAAARLKTLNDLWMTYEIAGVGLVDMAVWHWMYDHPKATPAQLRDATMAIAKDVWNRYYAPVFGLKDSTILGIYSHMISNFLYLPDYAIGHLIAHQIEAHLKTGAKLGPEFERMARYGSVAPDVWMRHATGKPVTAEPMLTAAAAALAEMERAAAPAPKPAQGARRK